MKIKEIFLTHLSGSCPHIGKSAVSYRFGDLFAGRAPAVLISSSLNSFYESIDFHSDGVSEWRAVVSPSKDEILASVVPSEVEQILQINILRFWFN
jgi:hypothetical protein